MTNKHKRKLAAATWSPEARAKRAATLAAKRAQLVEGGPRIKSIEGPGGKVVFDKRGMRKVKPGVSPVNDAIIYLRHSREAILAEVRGGRKVLMTRSEMYAMLALDALEGAT